MARVNSQRLATGFTKTSSGRNARDTLWRHAVAPERSHGRLIGYPGHLAFDPRKPPEGALSTVTPLNLHTLTGQSKTVREIWTFIEKVAAFDIGLCIVGTPDMGSLVARAIHDRSHRRHQPFLTFDCSGVPAES